VTDVFKGELDEVNGKLATSERMLSHMYRYLAKIDAELEAALGGGASAAVGSEGGAHGGANMSPSAALMEKTEL
jgi:hypothetical protein